MITVKVKLGIAFLIIGMGILLFYPAFHYTPEGEVAFHYIEIAGGIVLTLLGIMNIYNGRKEKEIKK